MIFQRQKDAFGFSLRSELFFISEPEAQTYVKGQIWAENFVPRAHWEARLPLGIDNYFHYDGIGVIGHHTHWDRCFDIVDCIKEVKKVQDYHMDGNGWWDVGYNFLIGEDGRIYEGRGFHIQGAHCSGWNTQTLGFTIMGSFISDLPNSRALNAAKQLMREMEKRGFIDERCWSFFGHRDKGNTTCPGDRLFEEFKEWKNFHREC
ncbi:unnamed protein product [Oikopleura dioica]|uniref:Peptidoglycan recognition protein family domain-containing protein n=1 Tax=Oikopleura dioica TaxID=34765 RepID=E4XWE5_OIKDI|nr:unnamed protein product [Oikopleura dioica]